MKKILLSRHAKTQQDSVSGLDFDRELAPKSEKQIPVIAQKMKDHGLHPQLWICSTAVRAQQTVDGLAGQVGFDRSEVVDEADVYGASALKLIEVLQEHAGDNDVVMVTGHNPGMSDCASYLCDVPVRLRTSAIAVVEVDVDDWEALGAGVGRLLAVLEP